MDSAVFRVIQALNPWLSRPELFTEYCKEKIPKEFIPRQAIGFSDWPISGKAHLLIGARQSGKSTLLWHWFLERGTPPLYLNCDELAIQQWCHSPALVATDIRGLTHPTTPVFFDEAQHLKEAGLVVKGLVDNFIPNPLFVTGSSSFHLLSKTRESLAGRAVRCQLHPLGLAELAAQVGDLPPLLKLARIRELGERHLIMGGYPEVWSHPQPETVLSRLIEAFVLRDASDLFHIENLSAFRRLLSLMAGQIGNLVNQSEWAGVCAVSRATIGHYLDILEQSQIILPIKPFAKGKRAEITRQPKIYFRDNGLCNAVLGRFTPWAEREDRGVLFENWIAAELCKHLSSLQPSTQLAFWRSKANAEVDFVIERPYGLLAVEVKATSLREPRLSRSSHSFLDAYQPKEFWVVNRELTTTQQVGPTLVHWVGPEIMCDAGFLDRLRE